MVYGHSVYVFSCQKKHHRTSLNSPNNNRANDWWLMLYSIQIWTPLPRWFRFEMNTFFWAVSSLDLSFFIFRFRCWFVVYGIFHVECTRKINKHSTTANMARFSAANIFQSLKNDKNEIFLRIFRAMHHAHAHTQLYVCCFYDVHISASLHDAIVTNIMRMYNGLLWIRNYVDCTICIKNKFKKEKPYKMRD